MGAKEWKGVGGRVERRERRERNAWNGAELGLGFWCLSSHSMVRQRRTQISLSPGGCTASVSTSQASEDKGLRLKLGCWEAGSSPLPWEWRTEQRSTAFVRAPLGRQLVSHRWRGKPSSKLTLSIAKRAAGPEGHSVSPCYQGFHRGSQP